MEATKWFLRGCIVGILLAIATGLAVTARSQSLEVYTVRPSPKGPVLTYADGCFVYGQLYAAVSQGKARGVPIEHYLKLAREPWPALAPMEGMREFLGFMFRDIYAAAPGFSRIPYKATMQRAINRCRDTRGETWRLHSADGTCSLTANRCF
jgi:hypothetical protein